MQEYIQRIISTAEEDGYIDESEGYCSDKELQIMKWITAALKEKYNREFRE